MGDNVFITKAVPAPKKTGGFVVIYKIIAKNIKAVIIQNAVTLVNAIFLAVSSLLMILGEPREAIFLGSVLVMNVLIGIIQDLRAKMALEKLQILAAPQIILILPDGEKRQIALEEVKKDDILQINIGDQVPADGRITESVGLEVNEALITGESNYIKKNTGDSILAGSIVMSGFGTLKVVNLPQDSYVSRMTEKIKKYKPNPSPIQNKLNLFIRYMSYLLLLIIIYVVAYGIYTHDLLVSMVRDIGALTGTLVPQGLVLSITVFFAYGAIRLLKDDVLMQEINATEKLGRIKNLCIDKTGTITERKPLLEETIIYNGSESATIGQLLAGYINANRDTSEVVAALRTRAALSFSGTVLGAIPFSSDRKYGIAWLNLGQESIAAVLGAPDILAGYFSKEEEKKLIKDQIDLYSRKAKRLILLVSAQNLPQGSFLDTNTILKPVALFILFDPLRPGTEKIIDFFQKRDVRIRVISGDDPRTVQAVAQQAGMKYADMVVTGAEMESWDDVEYEERVPAFHLFARVKPSQKEKIISRLKKTGYTAMVGDGANDALAIKKSDLGVAMFDGAAATRQIAQVVLMNNSFSALPKGVALAEAIILNIELVASVFLNKVVAGLVLFLSLAMMHYTYPLSPSGMTVVNYFTIWLPMAYWTLFPISNKGFDARTPFMGKIILFSVVNGLIMALAAIIIFLLQPSAARYADSNLLVMLSLIALGYLYFVLAPLNYGLVPDKSRRLVLLILALMSMILITAAIYYPPLIPIFGLQKPDFLSLIYTIGIIGIFGYIQRVITNRWFYRF